MFRLKLPTDPRWANIAEGNLEEILTDHAWCELKASSNAIMLINLLPEFTEITTELTKIAKEEMDHFEQVHEIIKARGWVLGRERKDSYVNDLFKFMKPGNRKHLIVERMLFAAMIEARSCERFKVLSDNIKDEELAAFYRDLMISEAGHYTSFLQFAFDLAEEGYDVKKRWEEWLEFEAKIIQGYGKTETIHG